MSIKLNSNKFQNDYDSDSQKSDIDLYNDSFLDDYIVITELD